MVVLIDIFLGVLILLHVEGIDLLLSLLFSLVFWNVVKQLVLLLLHFHWELLLRIFIVFFLLLNYSRHLIFLTFHGWDSLWRRRMFNLCWGDSMRLTSCTMGAEWCVEGISWRQRIWLLHRLLRNLLFWLWRSLFNDLWWLRGFFFVRDCRILNILNWSYFALSFRRCLTIHRIIVNIFLLIHGLVFNTVHLFGCWLLLNRNHAMDILCNVLRWSLVLLLIVFTHLINYKIY